MIIKQLSYKMSKTKTLDILSSYKYDESKPYFTIDKLSCYEAEHRDNSLKFTIKILKRADIDLVEYLKKMKSNNSQYTIKIHQFIHNPQKSQLIIVQEPATYGTLKNALKKCKRLDDDDCLTVSKYLLNGHIQLLRQGVYWFGDENDIEITDNGIKLSWNNTFPYSQNNQNPFPRILENIGMRKSTNSILQFPKNKMLEDLIKVSRQNASQMSLHPLLKKKQKVFKKKGKQWLAIKQTKIKGQYVQQLSYLAVNKQFGFIRVKVYQKGILDSEIIKIHQTNNCFIKILNYYEENGNWVTISEYSNDGTVQSYVKRLKNSAIQLKQNQIEFIFFSLIEPLKFISKSSVKSLNLLHIKNIYMNDGILKIGEPTPMSEFFKEVLKQKSQIPDFYHSEFKSDPDSRKEMYDTYSLGVLIYKLMYSEYPIFPEGKVHIPTTPSYKATLKSALLMFLANEPGSLQDLVQKIQVSQDVKAQVKNNQKVLQSLDEKGVKGKKITNMRQEEQRAEIISQFQEKGQQQDGKKGKRCGALLNFFLRRGQDRTGKYQGLAKSSFRQYKICVTSFIVVMLYFLAFFLPYMQGVFNLFLHTRLFSKVDVNIMGTTQTVITGNLNHFWQVYNSYNTNNDTSLYTLQHDMGCVIDNQNVYYEFVRPASPHWYLYLAFSLILMFIMLILKGIQTCLYSTSDAGFHYYDRTINGNNTSRFALSSFIFFQMWYAMGLWAFYYLFNIIFNEQHSPCFGGKNWTMLTQTLLTDRIAFTQNYFIIILVVFAFVLLSFLQISVFFTKINYDQLCNPIFIFTPFYLGLLIALRIGAFEKFQPSWVHNQNKIIGNGYMNTIGYFPQIIIVVQVLLSLLIDMIFYRCADKGLQKLLLSSQSFRLDQEVVEEQEKV